jgi:leucyl-tRNA synthetase
MSKSKRNTIDPEPIVDRYGADAVRWFMLSDSPPERDLEWSESGIDGAARFVQRVWRLVDSAGGNAGRDTQVDKRLHRVIAAVGEAIDGLQFNKSVAQLYELVGVLEKAPASASRDEAVRALIQLIAPMAPHLAEECWAKLGYTELVALSSWPDHDPALLIDDDVTIAVQINGKLRDTLSAPRGQGRDAIAAMALASEKVQRQLAGVAPRKVIVVPDRLVNIVA